MFSLEDIGFVRFSFVGISPSFASIFSTSSRRFICVDCLSNQVCGSEIRSSEFVTIVVGLAFV